MYTSFFPGLIYWIFGTSRQISIGTDSIVSLMVSASIQKYSSKFIPPDNLENLHQNGTSTKSYLSRNQNEAKILLASAQMFWVAIIQFIMFILRLGFLSIYLPDPLISSFSSATAIHIGTAQIKNIFGIKLSEHVGIFKIPKVFS